MPSIGAHMVIAKRVSEILKIDNSDFIRGNLLPDIIDMEGSHHKKQGKIYEVPDIEENIKYLDLNNYMDLGYLSHLLLDMYYLEEYLTKKYSTNVFIDGIIYKDYDIVNGGLVRLNELDVDKIESILREYKCNINNDKLELNIRCLKQDIEGSSKYLELDDFNRFLNDISVIISRELISYANKYSNNNLCVR